VKFLNYFVAVVSTVVDVLSTLTAVESTAVLSVVGAVVLLLEHAVIVIVAIAIAAIIIFFMMFVFCLNN
jgi:hypothetical protein